MFFLIETIAKVIPITWFSSHFSKIGTAIAISTDDYNAFFKMEFRHMSPLVCLESPSTEEQQQTKCSLTQACRDVRRSWSREERARRKQVAEMKQIGLLLNTIDMTTFLKAVAAS
ncbi:hypothetical protein C5Y96_23100 [Blastopirellula marina]|uniref:Uncharacterized protein n=1 Tax=Blastopirellula marina TaxID=124 RepID=A0A2S8F0Q5_9BACT|nr:MULTISPECIES: hypothetical protein [Pirellulaceae]PQO25707.1 hypothetical protein C5Y96_23100 [Blastopirellula marina]RCS43390.1 hypothetical protein DTL36_23150 [Bremerella cremea]